MVNSFILLADILCYKICQAGVIQNFETLYSYVLPLVQHWEVPSILSEVKTQLQIVFRNFFQVTF